MITAAAMAGILAGLARGGRWSNLTRQRLQAPYLLIISWLCEIGSARGAAAAIARLFDGFGIGIGIGAGTGLAQAGNDTGFLGILTGGAGPAASVLLALAAIQYLTVLLFIGFNIQKPGMGLFLIGSIMNGAVILANGGRMPVGPLAARFGELALQRIASTPHYLLASGSEPLIFLGDWLPFWSIGWYMVSIGDFFIAFGVFQLAYRFLRPATLPISALHKVEYGAEYVYTRERSLTSEERGMVIYGLYRYDFRESEKRPEDDRPAGKQRSAHDRGRFPDHGPGHRQYNPYWKERRN